MKINFDSDVICMLCDEQRFVSKEIKDISEMRRKHEFGAWFF